MSQAVAPGRELLEQETATAGTWTGSGEARAEAPGRAVGMDVGEATPEASPGCPGSLPSRLGCCGCYTERTGTWAPTPTPKSLRPSSVPCSRSAHLSPSILSNLQSARLGRCGIEPSCPAGITKRHGLAFLHYFSFPCKVYRCLESLLRCDWNCS